MKGPVDCLIRKVRVRQKIVSLKFSERLFRVKGCYPVNLVLFTGIKRLIRIRPIRFFQAIPKAFMAIIKNAMKTIMEILICPFIDVPPWIYSGFLNFIRPTAGRRLREIVVVIHRLHVLHYLPQLVIAFSFHICPQVLTHRNLSLARGRNGIEHDPTAEGVGVIVRAIASGVNHPRIFHLLLRDFQALAEKHRLAAVMPLGVINVVDDLFKDNRPDDILLRLGALVPPAVVTVNETV